MSARRGLYSRAAWGSFGGFPTRRSYAECDSINTSIKTVGLSVARIYIRGGVRSLKLKTEKTDPNFTLKPHPQRMAKGKRMPCVKHGSEACTSRFRNRQSTENCNRSFIQETEQNKHCGFRGIKGCGLGSLHTPGSGAHNNTLY